MYFVSQHRWCKLLECQKALNFERPNQLQAGLSYLDPCSIICWPKAFRVMHQGRSQPHPARLVANLWRRCPCEATSTRPDFRQPLWWMEVFLWSSTLGSQRDRRLPAGPRSQSRKATNWGTKRPRWNSIPSEYLYDNGVVHMTVSPPRVQGSPDWKLFPSRAKIPGSVRGSSQYETLTSLLAAVRTCRLRYGREKSHKQQRASTATKCWGPPYTGRERNGSS